MALNSTTSVKLLDLLCEGPIGGVIGGKQGVFLNETPIQADEDGEVFNFDADKVEVELKNGSEDQESCKYFSQVSQIVGVGVEVGENYSEELSSLQKVKSRDYGGGTVIRQITDTNVDEIQLLFTIPKLFSVSQEGLTKGQLFGGTLKIKVFIQDVGSGGAYNEVQEITKSGVSTNNFQFLSNQFKLPGTGPWNIKVEKVDLGEGHFAIKFADFDDVDEDIPLESGRGNQLIWSSITEYVNENLDYNYSALAELQISSEVFPNLPSRAYLIKGRLVKIPNGAVVDPDDGHLLFGDEEETFEFDGGLQEKEVWTTCPICCFYDLLTNTRYGCGDFVDAANLSWIDLHPLAQYANQLVTTPDGTQEPRFACNVVIGDQADAYSVLRDMASVFRGMLFWSSNVIQVAADHGELDGSALSPKHVYSNSNVINGVFEYSGSSLATRSTSIRVRYNDPDNFYKPNIVVVEDPNLIAKYGYRVKELIGFGCTSKWQAQRVGRWAIQTENLDEEVVVFSTGLEGAVVLPGEIFSVADELRQGARISGRVASATTSSVVADQSITLPTGANPKLTCVLPDGTVETKAISSVSGSTINLSASFSSAPLTQSVWSIATDSVALQKFRCLSVTDGGNGTFAITGVTHNDSIYASVDTGEELTFLDVTTLDDAPPPVQNISFDSGQVFDGTGQDMQATISWAPGA